MKLRHGEGSIESRQRADGGTTWRVRWYGVDGKRKSKTFPSEAQAHAHLLEVSGRKRRQRYRDPSTMTVGEAAEEWLERGWRDWNGGTGATYEFRVEKHILPRFGRVRVADLTTPMIQRWVDSLDRSPSTVSSLLSTLGRILDECVRMGYIDTNPARLARAPRQRATRMTVWSEAHIRTMLDYVADKPRWKAMYLLALSTGMRPGEMRALRWEDVDLDAGTVVVRRTVVKSGGATTLRDTTKTGHDRTLSLPSLCVEALRAWRVKSRSPWVMSTRDAPLHDVTWRQAHQRMCAAAGVPEIGLHGLRHTAATRMMRLGVHPRVAADILGHTTVSMTLDTYTHPEHADYRQAVEMLQHEWEAGPENE